MKEDIKPASHVWVKTFAGYTNNGNGRRLFIKLYSDGTKEVFDEFYPPTKGESHHDMKITPGEHSKLKKLIKY